MTDSSDRKVSYLNIVLTILLLGALGGVAYLYNKSEKLTFARNTLENEKSSLITDKNDLISNLELASSTITTLAKKLEMTAEELDGVENDYRREKRKNDDFEDEYRETIETIKDLDKLSKTDEELLQKYSKVYFLNENYIPSNIKKIDDEFILAGKDDQYFHGDALPFLEKLLDKAAEAGHQIKIVSAYRSFDEQTSLKGHYTQTYGSGANAFSADQGYSEHQLGTTIDLTVDEVGGTYDSFAETEAYQWLIDNAYRYGFVISYPEDNGFYIFEPWHWRFVGEELARDLHKDDAHFYDWDQREIDKYLLNIFD